MGLRFIPPPERVPVFLVVAGYSSNQIAPVTGLLGTLAGYLLGKGK